MVDVDRETYDELIEDQLMLRALEACGLDNWEGYNIAIDLLQEWEKD